MRHKIVGKTSGLLCAILGGFGVLITACGPQEAPVLVSYADSEQVKMEEEDALTQSARLPKRLDEDQDGAPVWMDCDDSDPSMYPDAPEFCDGKDNDCDFIVDDNPVDGDIYYLDGDGDGYGDEAVVSCVSTDLYSDIDGDCDDSRDDIHPEAEPTCDGADSNCDGSDEDEAAHCDEFDPGGGDDIDDLSSFDPGGGDEIDDLSSFDPGEGDEFDDISYFDPNQNP